jgi:hypothetical protein
MLLQKRHVALKLRAVMRKLLQKIPHQLPVQQVMTVIQIHATVIVAVVVEGEDVVAHKVKAQKDPIQIHRKIQQKVQKMVLRPTLQMAPRIVAVVAVVQQEKMSLQEKLLMKMASSLSSRFAKFVNVQLAQSVQSAQNAELGTVVNAIVVAIVTAVIHVEIIVSHTAVVEL